MDTSADATDREKDRERLLGRFAYEPRDILRRVPVTIGEVSPGLLGRYFEERPGKPPRIEISPRAPYEFTLQHEILHGLHDQYEPYRRDAQAGFPELVKAVFAVPAYAKIVEGMWGDPWHVFTAFGQLSLEHPEYLSDEIYRYFLPLRQGVVTD